jgi:nucleotide-binding universal stress UspA family protein
MMQRIVVGVDGSPASRAALALAADIATRFDAALRVVETWEFTPMTALAGGETDLDELQRAAEHRLDRLVREVLGDDALESVERLASSEAPVPVLLREAEDADLLVVGRRGLGGFKGLLVGSVSQQLTTHATCPVLTVPDPGSGS